MNTNHVEIKAVSTAAASTVGQTPDPDLQSVAPATSRRPTFVKARREYIDFFAKYTRSPYNAAKLYSYLVFHAQRNKKGLNAARLEVVREGGPWEEPAYWWVQTRKDIASACAMTEDQFRTAMQVLEKAEVATHRRGRYTGRLKNYTGKTVSHIRLGVCQRGNGLDAWPSVEQMAQMRIVLGGDKPPMISGAKPPGFLDALVVTQDSITEERNIKDASEKLLAEQQGQDQSSKPLQGKTNPTPKALEAWKNFKAEYNKAAHNGENLKEQVSLEWATDEQKFVQRVEFRAAQRFGSAEGFFAWLTPFHWQGTGFKYLDDDPRPNIFHLHAHHDVFFDAYQAFRDAEAAKPIQKPIKWASATSPLEQVPAMADAPESTATTPPTSPAACQCMGAETQAAVASVPAVPVQVEFDLINPNKAKFTAAEAAAWDYMDLLRVDHLVDAAT